MYKKIFILTIIILLPQCGKKKRNFYFSDSNAEAEKINKLSFSSVREATITKADSTNELNWSPTKNALGYNVYKFGQGKFIKRKPINKELITDTSFIDKKISKKNWCYLIRAVYKVKNIKIEGPTSKIVS